VQRITNKVAAPYDASRGYCHDEDVFTTKRSPTRHGFGSRFATQKRSELWFASSLASHLQSESQRF
jgi:hypothetical protein